MNTSFLKQADQVLVVGEDMKQRLLNQGISASRVTTIPNWVDLEFIRPLSKKNTLSEKYHLDSKFVVLYAGNFGRIYNFGDLLDAAEKLRENREIVFLFVGDGALKEKLIREAGSRRLGNILMVPLEPRSQVPEVLAVADVSVVLLNQEMTGLSVPSKIYSFLASGRPILACVEEGSEIARIVRESKAGFVVAPGQGEKLAAAIKELYQKPELKSQLGSNARRFVEEQDFQARAFHAYEQIFGKVLNGRVKTDF